MHRPDPTKKCIRIPPAILTPAKLCNHVIGLLLDLTPFQRHSKASLVGSSTGIVLLRTETGEEDGERFLALCPARCSTDVSKLPRCSHRKGLSPHMLR